LNRANPGIQVTLHRYDEVFKPQEIKIKSIKDQVSRSAQLLKITRFFGPQILARRHFESHTLKIITVSSIPFSHFASPQVHETVKTDSSH